MQANTVSQSPTLTSKEIAHQQLLKRSARHELILSTLSEGVLTQTLEGGVETFNASACQILGLTPDQLTGRDSMDPRWAAVREDGSAFAGEAHPAMVTLRTGQPCSGVVMGIRLPSSEVRWISINTRLLAKVDPHERDTAIVSFHDITELLKTQEELGRARDTADLANRTKSQFLANMSHEIRTPMTAILGFADRLQEPNLTDADRSDCVETIRRNGAHLMRVIDDVLDLSKIEAGKMTVENISVDPMRKVNDVVTLMGPLARERGLTLSVSIQPGVPKTIGSDPTRLRQILLNLVGNAIKFTLTGEVRIEVSTTEPGTDKPQRVRFSVSDTGVGMTAEQMAKLFQPFSQADPSTTRKFGGTGLGLTICRGLAERLGGTLEVQSNVGKGSRFTLSLDAGASQNQAVHASAPIPALAVAIDLPSLAGRRVLLADDGPDNQRLIAHFLRTAGAELVIADNGKIACDLAMASVGNDARFDLILMDMAMPIMDGHTATRTLRGSGWTGPIIALTAHSLEEERQACMTAGCSGFLGKPFTRDGLIRSVHTAINTQPVCAEPIRSTLENDPAMAELLRLYIAELPAIAEEFERPAGVNEMKRLLLLAHRLRGSGGSYGFPQISAAAAKLEQLIKSNAPPAMRSDAMAELIAILRRVADGFSQLPGAGRR